MCAEVAGGMAPGGMVELDLPTHPKTARVDSAAHCQPCGGL